MNAEACLRLRVLGPSPPLTTWAMDLMQVAVPRYLKMVANHPALVNLRLALDQTETALQVYQKWRTRYPKGMQKTLDRAMVAAYGGLQLVDAPHLNLREAVVEGITDSVRPQRLRHIRPQVVATTLPTPSIPSSQCAPKTPPDNPLYLLPHLQHKAHRLSCPNHPLNLPLQSDLLNRLALVGGACPCGAEAVEGVEGGVLEETVRVKAFLKLEEMNKPRNISPMPPEVAVVLGPQISRAEGVLGHLPWFIKGMNLPQREKMMSVLLGFKNYAETDYATFDKTYGQWMREIEIGVQRPYWTTDISSLLEQVYTKLYSNFKITHVNGWTCRVGRSQRLSGENATSIGNGSANHFVTWVAFGMPDLSVEDPTLPLPFVSLHEGDDGIVGCTTPPQPQLQDVAREFGLDMTCDWYKGLDNIKFTGRYWYEDRGTVYSMCAFWRTLNKFHLATCSTTSRTPQQWRSERLMLLGAKALSRMVLDYRTPVIGAIAWAIYRRTRSNQPAKLLIKKMKATGARAIVNYDTRILLAGAVHTTWDTCPAPVFDRVRAGHLVLQEGVPSIERLEEIHWEWIGYGHGIIKDLPLPLVNPPRSGEANHLELE